MCQQYRVNTYRDKERRSLPMINERWVWKRCVYGILVQILPGLHWVNYIAISRFPAGLVSINSFSVSELGRNYMQGSGQSKPGLLGTSCHGSPRVRSSARTEPPLAKS